MSLTTTLSGVDVPDVLTSRERECEALRRSATLTRLPHMTCIRLSGPGAQTWAGVLVAGGEELRPGEAHHGVLLDDDGVVLADVWLVARRDELWLISDGLPAESLLQHCREGIGDDVEVEPLTGSRDVWTLDGPFAWEVMARYDSPGVIGLPPLTWYLTDDGTLVVRTGRTGEYGYLLLIPTKAKEQVVASIMEAGGPLELVCAGVAALATAALENFCFWPHREGRFGLTPLELQLQWRLPPHAKARGVAAVVARRAERWTQRISLVHGAELEVGDSLRSGEKVIGRVLGSEPWQHGDGWIGLALLDLDHAHPGFLWDTDRGPVQTLSAPLVTNRSLFVRPQRHAWRDEASLPGLVPRVLGATGG